jgi:hypothetical protein
VGLEELLDAMLIGIVKGTTFVLVRKTLEENEKTTISPSKRKGGLIKK